LSSSLLRLRLKPKNIRQPDPYWAGNYWSASGLRGKLTKTKFMGNPFTILSQGITGDDIIRAVRFQLEVTDVRGLEQLPYDT
jgi:hypothetical protein